MNVAQFAGDVGLPTSLLLEQLRAAGVNKAAEDTLTEQDKNRLLDYLRRVHGAKDMTLFQQTFSYSNGTPIVSSIRSIVGNRTDVLVLDYRRDEAAFKALWALDSGNVPTEEAGKRLLDDISGANKTIILIDVDASTVIASDKFGRHVSAIDWAHVVYFALYRSGSDLPKITVLDLRDPDSNALKEYGRFRPPCGIEYFRCASSKDIENFSDWLNKLKSGEAAAANFDKNELRVTFKQWAAGISHADSRADHHSLNNTVGPLVLAGGCPDAVRRDVLLARKKCDGGSETHNLGAAAMMRGFEWFGARPAEAGAPVNELVPLDWPALFQSSRLKTNKELRILLLDDQANEGWIPVFAHMFGMTVNGSAPGSANFVEVAARPATQTTPKISLYAATTPEAVLGHISSKNRFSLRLTTPEGAAIEVLFADLRLFSEREGAEREIEYFKRVLEIAMDGVIGQDEYASLKSWLSSIDPRVGYQTWRESPKYLQALTLLVRTIASRDLSFPIALFSSTGQRAVTNALAGYPSISTALEKPKFDSYVSTDINADFGQRLGDVLANHALPYASARAKVRQLLDFVPEEEVPPPASPLYIEIFTDESGSDDRDKSFVVSLIAVAYTPGRNGWEKAESLNNALRNVNISLPGRPEAKLFTYDKKIVGHIEKPDRQTRDDDKHKSFRGDTAILFNALLAEEEILNIKALTLLGNRDTHAKENVLGDEGLDQLNFGMLKAGIEALLFELVSDSQPSNIHASIYLGTRTRPLARPNTDTDREYDNRASLFTKRWGIRCKQHRGEKGNEYKWHYPSIIEGTPPRLLSEVLALRGKAATVSLYIDSCRHEWMNSSENRPTREIHHLADEFASGVNSSLIARDKGFPGDPFEWLKGIGRKDRRFDYAISEYGASFESALNATRLFDAGDMASALLFGCLAVSAHKPGAAVEDQIKLGHKGAVRLLLRKSKQAAAKISPEKYAAFVGDLREQAEIDGSGVMRLIARKKSSHSETLSGLCAERPAVPSAETIQGARERYGQDDNVAAERMQPHDKKLSQKKQQEIESVFVQSVEPEGLWVTFNKNNIGKVNKVSNPPSGWCPLNGQAALPAVGDEIKVVFDPDGLGYKEGFCLVRLV